MGTVENISKKELLNAIDNPKKHYLYVYYYGRDYLCCDYGWFFQDIEIAAHPE